jgi:Dual specificity phosphatase, catalytic domain
LYFIDGSTPPDSIV